MSERSVLLAGARTPVGRLMGSLGSLSAVDLGGVAIAAAVERSGVSPSQIQHVIMGHVVQAGTGQITARQAAVQGGIAMSVPATTVNKVCLSGLSAIALADQLIRAGEFDLVVAGGMESMSQAPHLLPQSRRGVRFGDAAFVDALSRDGLWDVFTDTSMGTLTDRYNAKLDDAHTLSRSEQDAYAARSHQRAARARDDGRFEAETVPVRVPSRRGEDTVVTEDEGIRPDTTPEALAALPTAFADDGTITAGSSSQMSDGGAAVVIARRETAERLGVPWLAEVGMHGTAAGPDSSLQQQPARALVAACHRAGLSPGELDVVEINEAFAAVALASARELGLDEERVNVNGGAIALGHPLGMSGTRIALHLVHELARRGGGVGGASLCGGGGQGDALLFHVPAVSEKLGVADETR